MTTQTLIRPRHHVFHRHGAPTVTAPVVRAESTTSTTTNRILAVARVSTGFVFLWAFLDKTFGLGYSTPSAQSWINGGSPTKGFLSPVAAGPFQSMFHSMAGNGLVDVLFMAGMLGIGVAFIAGVALRPAAVAGVAMMALMWAAEWPLAKHGAAGATGSTNPIVDYHVIYALVVASLAALNAGRTWGFAKQWQRLPIVQRHHALG